MKLLSDMSNRVQPEVIDCMMEFFGFAITPYTLLKVILIIVLIYLENF
jgi:hypothetical protein